MDDASNRWREDSAAKNFRPPPEEISGPTIPPGVLFRETPGAFHSSGRNRKGWLRIGVSDNEILFRRLDLPGMEFSRFDPSPAVEKANGAAPTSWL